MALLDTQPETFGSVLVHVRAHTLVLTNSKAKAIVPMLRYMTGIDSEVVRTKGQPVVTADLLH